MEELQWEKVLEAGKEIWEMDLENKKELGFLTTWRLNVGALLELPT